MADVSMPGVWLRGDAASGEHRLHPDGGAVSERAGGVEPEFIVGPLYMGDTGEGTQTLTVDVLIVWPDDE